MFNIEILWRQDPEFDNGFPSASNLIMSDRDAFLVAFVLNACADVVGIRIRDMRGCVLSKNEVNWHLSKRIFED